MKLTPPSFRAGHRQRGWALLVVMSVAAVGLMTLAGVMSWANENATVAARNNEYFATSYAAEAATEKVLSAMSQQYQNFGFPLLVSNMSTYASTLPTASDGTYWSSYQFSGGRTANQIIVTNIATGQTIVESGTYAGLFLMANTYEIIANAQNTTTEFKIVSTVGQQIYFGTIPLFQFAIFYQNDMEICPAPLMTVTGPVHGNGNIYLCPGNGLVFNNTVTSVSNVYLHQSPEDPEGRTFSYVNFDGTPAEQTNVSPLNLPVGTNTTGTVSNTSQNAYAILALPTAGQGPTSATGTNLLYNQADMIIIISNNNTVAVTSGAIVNSQATVISQAQWTNFLSTNGTFYDQRDSLTVQPVVINVSNLVTWSANTNTAVNPLRPVLTSYRGSGAANVQSIYVADLRTKSSTQPGIVLSNGAVLPPQGLSIATPDPAYVVGNWNVQAAFGGTSDAGSADTTYTHPSAIFADAITVLSSAWNPANSSASYSTRNVPASGDTVNAAFFAGIVPSNGSSFSGGVENFPRFLENWNGANFYYNGSIVEMFTSQIAKQPFVEEAPTQGAYYTAPTRYWAFDNNFSNPAKQPPMTPQIIKVQPGKWAMLPPFTTSF
jgi:hypothetical protein